MITKIKFNDSYKQFQNTETPSDLKKYNLFYGMNGTGKSTISRLFHILEEYQKNPNFDISKYSEIQNAQLTYNDSIIDWNNLADFYQDNDIFIRVFNQDYIRRTINTQENKECEAIFVLGAENQNLKDELSYLQREKQNFETQKQTKIETKNQLFEPKFDSSGYAKSIREKLNRLTQPTELINSYEFKETHLRASLSQRKETVLTEQDKDTYIKVIKNNNEYRELNAPKIETDINSLINDTIIILKKTVESQTIERLEQNQQLKKWVRDGYSQFSKNAKLTNFCPFCEQSITQEFWSTLSNAFTDQQAEFANSIQTLINKISEKKSAIASIKIIDSSNVYPIITNIVDTIQNFQTAVSNISSILDRLLAKLNEKKNLLNSGIEIDIQYDNTNEQSITNYISMIAYHNDGITNSTRNFNYAKNSLLSHEIASLQSTYDKYSTEKNNYEKQISTIHEEIKTIDNNLNAKNKEITNKQQEIKRQNTNIEQINNALHKYMGHKSIKFIVAGIDDDITFKLIRLDENENIIANNEPVFLSEGEATLVAFTYFIHQLENRDLDIQEEKKSNYIIVIDDPITSMDIDFIYYIISMIRELLEKDRNQKQTLTYQFNQVFFMTHHFMLFRELWKILYDGRDNKYKTDFNYYLLERRNKNLSINELPDFYKKHDTEYLYIFQSLKNLGQNLDDYQLKYYAPNLSRKLLDVFTAFKYAHNKKRFEQEFKSKCERELGIDYLTLKRYTDRGSHLEIYDTINNFSLLQKMPSKILECIKILDKDHYDSMINKE